MNAILERLQTYGDKIALGAGIFALIGYFVYAQFLSPGVPMVDSVKEKVSQVEGALAKNEPTKMQLPDFVGKVKEPWEPKLSAVSAGRLWSYYKRPTIAVATLAAIVPGETYVHAPLLEKPAIELASVTVSWRPNPQPSAAVVSEYRVFRGEAGRPHELAGTVSGKEASFKDAKVMAKTRYSYYVVALTEDENCKKKESDPSETIQVDTVDDIALEYRGGSPLRAIILIKKYVPPPLAKWVVYTDQVRLGERIGKPGRKVIVENQAHLVNFDTGYTLLEIRTDRYYRKVGDVLIPGDRQRIVVLDEAGNLRTFWTP